jgi:hypothetical protein
MIHQLVRNAKKIISTAISATDQRNDYYHSRIYFRRMLRFFSACNEAHQDGTIKYTDATISPLALKFGASTSSIKKELGAPKYVYDDRNSGNNHVVYFYRRTFADISLLVQVQFFNNELFFIGLDVVKRLIHDNEKTEIINTVIEKYLNKPYKKGEQYPLIQDPDKNFIIINDDINFSICYLSGNVDREKQKKIIASMDIILNEKPDKGSLFYAF